MKLDVYKFDAETGRTSQTEIEKTVTAETYDLMFGTVEDILGLLDAIGDTTDADAVLKAITVNWDKLCVLLLDVFPEMTRDDLKHVKVREVVPVIVELFKFVVDGFGGGASAKNR